MKLNLFSGGSLSDGEDVISEDEGTVEPENDQVHVCVQSEQIKALLESNKVIRINQHKLGLEINSVVQGIFDQLEDINARLKSGNLEFKKIENFMVEKKVENGVMKEDIQETKEEKKTLEYRVRRLEESRVTWEYLKKNVEDKIPSTTLTWINTIVLSLFILAIIFDNARDTFLMRLLGL